MMFSQMQQREFSERIKKSVENTRKGVMENGKQIEDMGSNMLKDSGKAIECETCSVLETVQRTFDMPDGREGENTENPASEHMKYEWTRYASFHSFPNDSPVSPSRLAKAGFYHLGKGDETVCFSCGLKIRNWQCGEEAMEKHSKLSPRCPFVRGTSDNVPIGPPKSCEKAPVESTHTASTIPEIRSKTTVSESETGKQSASNTPIPAQPVTRLPKAKRPEYSKVEDRIASFVDWPQSLAQRPRELAEAGLFFAGIGDCVRCFQCGGGLRNWEYGDEPWEEHARWYPDCAHVRRCKGDEFVERMKREVEQWEVQASQPEPQTTAASNMPSPQKGHQEEVTSNRKNVKENTEPLSSVAALSVMEFGYSREVVEKAIDKLERKGTPASAENILKILLEDEDKESKSSSSSQQESDIFEISTTTDRQEVPFAAEESSSCVTASPSKLEEQSQECGSTQKENDEKRMPKQESTSINSEAVRNKLLDENRQLKEHMVCKICMDDDACVVFLPCSHMIACPQCAPALRKCPICRKLIRGTVRAYLS